jgi:zinc protease
MGYGELSPPDLERVLAGTTASVTPDIGSLFEGLSGGSSVDDLELLLQLIHLKMTSPRRDEDAFDALKRQFLALVANQSAQPQYQFQRVLQERYSNGHLRTMPVDTEGVSSIRIDDVLSTYEDRFGDAGDFTFLFVGNLDPGVLAPLVESYLGSLPSTGRHDAWVDRHVTRPDGIVVDSVRSGVDPVSQVAVLFHGPYEFSQDNNYAIRAVERLLDIRMQEVIREDQSGTYGVGVQAQFVRLPDSRYTILITFRADPDRVDQLTELLFSVVEEIRTTVPDPDYVRRIQETQRSSFEEGLSNNEFWLGQVQYALTNERPLSAVMRYLDLVDALDGEAILEAARTYLDTDRYVQVTLYPAGDGQ